MELIQVIQYSSTHIEVEFKNSKGIHFDYEVFKGEDGEHSMCRNGIDYAGVWTENNRVVDYDMVFELSKAAIITLRKAGIIVPRSFEPDN